MMQGKYSEKKGIEVNALYSVQMPDTWTPIFDLSDNEKVKKRLIEADKEIESVVKDIKERKNGNKMRRALPYAVRYISDILYRHMRKTKHLSVNGDCISCFLCVKNCPAEAIRMEDGKPVWVKSECVMCLRCLHHCPKNAIEYDRKTKKHGQYHHPEERNKGAGKK